MTNTITNVIPSSGGVGTPVIVQSSSYDFSSVTGILFGTVLAPATMYNSGAVIAYAPAALAANAGVVNLTAVTSGGNYSSSVQFTLSSVTPPYACYIKIAGFSPTGSGGLSVCADFALMDSNGVLVSLAGYSGSSGPQAYVYSASSGNNLVAPNYSNLTSEWFGGIAVSLDDSSMDVGSAMEDAVIGYLTGTYNPVPPANAKIMHPALAGTWISAGAAVLNVPLPAAARNTVSFVWL
jgi:hypothetical protein